MKVDPYCKNCGQMGHYDSQCQGFHMPIPRILTTVKSRGRDGKIRERVIEDTATVTKRDAIPHCPTCRCGGPKSQADRARAYRARNKK
jgi:hypothetical protein